MLQIQHGDVLIQQIKSMPDGLKRIRSEHGLLIIARGETTGHHHAIAVKEKEAILYELKGELYLEVAMPVKITHEEHKPLDIPTGIYKIGRVQEHDYLLDMERQVRD
mgnify:CR=1 FL=1